MQRIKTALLDLLRLRGPLHADVLALDLKLPVAELHSLLIGLEMLGQIRRLPGARYEALS